jgi:hypothetical protein
MYADNEPTLVINPLGVDEDALTREYVRPKRPQPVEWARRQAKASRRRAPSSHTRTLTVPALRYQVGMPIVPALPAAPVPVARTASAPNALGRAALAALATLTLLGAVALAFAGLGATKAAAPTDGEVVVSVYGVSSPPTDYKVIADGNELCSWSPCRFTLEPGEHFITVVAPGFERQQARKVVVAEGRESNLHFELAPRMY